MINLFIDNQIKGHIGGVNQLLHFGILQAVLTRRGTKPFKIVHLPKITLITQAVDLLC